MRWALAVTLLFSLSCAGNDGVNFNVRLRTDMIPAAEFDRIVVTIDGQNEERVDASSPSFLYSAGAVVATYTTISSGEHTVRVELTRLGTVVVGVEQLVMVSDGGSTTVVITRSCAGVECSGSSNLCLGGECVDSRCTPETPATCPADRCTSAAECGASPQACLTTVCREGACLAIDEGSCGDGNYCDAAQGCRPYDRIVDGGTSDAGVDVGSDAGPPPCDPICEGFDICEDGACVPATGCLTAEECDDGLICRNRRCVPPTQDVDGDGSPASEDCNELRPEAYPGAPELCNSLDEDCDDNIDEGNPGVLCTEEGGECMDGTCGCPPGMLDLDGVPDTGCECTITPEEGTTGSMCAMPFGLGSLDDSGQMMTVSGNALPMGREVWYSVIGSDTPDTACDTYNFRARFTDNPGDAFRLEVRRSACDAMTCDMAGAGFTEYNFATNFRDGAGLGECPCAPAPGRPGRNICSNNTATYYVRVFRRPDAELTCAPYTLELSNGVE